jgi:hypothetical protein
MMTRGLKIILGTALGGLVGGVIGTFVGCLSLMCFMDGLIMGGRRVPAEEQIRVVAIACAVLGAFVVAILMLFISQGKVRG